MSGLGGVLLQYGRFSLVGVLATVVNTVLTVVFTEVFEVNPTVSVVLAFPIAFLVSYRLNQTWTFAVQTDHRRQGPRYLVGQVFGLALNALIMFVVNELVGWDYRIAIAITLFVVPPVVFLFQRAWTFRLAIADGSRSQR